MTTTTQSETASVYGTAVLGIVVAMVALVLFKFKSLLSSLAHPSEVAALFRFFTSYQAAKIPKTTSSAETYSYIALTKTSRSFAAVILEVHEELRLPIAIFYLVLRGLDTIEDDMEIPLKEKLSELMAFPDRLDEKGWNSRKGYGKSNIDEQQLLENFENVIEVFQSLKPAYRKVIQANAREMASGMCQFQQQDVRSLKDYYDYCHYVAGIVGIGLSQLFHASGLEGARFQKVDDLANSMGLFLQKVNITRDYLDDITQQPPRVFYPKEIWNKYVDKVEQMKEPEFKKQSLACLNNMVADALDHIPDCIEYMSLVRTPSVFKFCAIPQVMAIATLELCYNNYQVFQKEIKIRKGLTVQLIMDTTDFKGMLDNFEYFVDKLNARLIPTDPSFERSRKSLTIAKARIAKARKEL